MTHWRIPVLPAVACASLALVLAAPLGEAQARKRGKAKAKVAKAATAVTVVGTVEVTRSRNGKVKRVALVEELGPRHALVLDRAARRLAAAPADATVEVKGRIQKRGKGAKRTRWLKVKSWSVVSPTPATEAGAAPPTTPEAKGRRPSPPDPETDHGDIDDEDLPYDE